MTSSAEDLLIQLIQCPSITPNDAGCLEIIERYLRPFNFSVERFDQGGTSNAYVKLSRVPINLCFAGHTDVVPTIGDNLWRYPPFQGVNQEGHIYGRGAVDMKGAIAAFLSIVPRLIQETEYSLSLLFTSDEEGEALHGTQIVVKELLYRKERIDLCVVGEPTSEILVGDTLKWGRRGSLSGRALCKGVGGHVAYPQKAKNPIPFMLSFLQKLHEKKLDDGCEGFDPSNLEITSVDVGNGVTNIIPETVNARFNIRFNPHHRDQSLRSWIEDAARESDVDVEFFPSSQPFYGMTAESAHAISTCLGIPLSTSGGTSDARFIKDLCPVIELGLKNETAHHIDEYVSVQDLHTLSELYFRLFKNFSDIKINR